MKKINLVLFVPLTFIFFLTSCQSVKDGLSGRKSENSDEFLVQKKNPLVLPPDYGKLPRPVEEEVIENNNSSDDIKTIISDSKNLVIKTEKNSNQSSIEESILEKIK